MSTTRPFPGFSQLYSLHDPHEGNPFRARVDSNLDDPDAAVRGEVQALSVTARYAMGQGRPKDVVYTTFGPPVVLISERLRGLLLDSALSGWSTTPCALFDKKGDAAEAYHLLVITGRCGGVDESRGVRFMAQYPAGEFPRWRGLFFDPESWDGSDFFMSLCARRSIFVTEPVKNVFSSNDIENVEFTALDTIEFDRLGAG